MVRFRVWTCSLGFAVAVAALATVAACSTAGDHEVAPVAPAASPLPAPPVNVAPAPISSDGGGFNVADGGPPRSSLCAPKAATCEATPGKPDPCCEGTTCQTDLGWVHCVHDQGGSCASDSDCAVGWSCTKAGVCGYPPKCAATGEACGADRPEISSGCCDPLQTCESSVYPSRCCRPGGAACGVDGDCCTGLTCGKDHTCAPPTCAPLGDTLSCSLFPSVPCCDPRLSCKPVDANLPATKHCCAAPGTVLTAADGAICCSGGVFTAQNGTMTCAQPPPQ
jgi:hypothetical protein